MRNVSIQNSLICAENDSEFYEKWFCQKKEKQFINHVDTLYFMVTPEIEDYKSSPQWQEFLKTIADIKKIAEEHREKIGIFQNIMPNLEVRPFTGALMYSLHFGLYQNYDIFVCTGVPNKDTPPIMVQIRSNALWVEGMKNIFDRAYDCVERVLDSFGIKIEKIQENRIDYAFHTNYINNAMTFFPEKDLGKMFVGNFERGRKDYNFHTHEDDEQGNGDRIVESDYFTLGRHKSNNVFFRAYNKTKEVIEMGEKQFFIPIWLKYGLINKFDEYVLKKTFIDGRYESVDRARCEFYYDYGSDNQIKREIGEKLLDKGTPAKWYTKKAKGLVPGLTIVSNIEIQTKRKFYDRKRLQNVTTEESPKKRIYNIFDQMSELIRFITDDTIRFVSYKGKYAKTPRIKRPMSDWWKRLRRAKKVEITEEWEIEYLHIYQHNLDFERQKQLMLKKQAKTAAYVDYSQGKIFDNMDVEINPKYCMVLDFQNFFEYLNDNDFKKYYINKSDGFKEIMQKNHQNNVAEKKLEKRESPKYRQKQLKLVDENDIQYEKDLNALYSVKGLSPQEYRQKQIDLYLEYCKNKKNVQ